MNPDCRVQDQLNGSEPTVPYVKAWEIKLVFVMDQAVWQIS